MITKIGKNDEFTGNIHFTALFSESEIELSFVYLFYYR